jgi:hypothetical protein
MEIPKGMLIKQENCKRVSSPLPRAIAFIIHSSPESRRGFFYSSGGTYSSRLYKLKMKKGELSVEKGGKLPPIRLI